MIQLFTSKHTCCVQVKLLCNTENILVQLVYLITKKIPKTSTQLK